MFCPNCGKGEQTPDTYCRNCGEFLADFSNKLSLINKVFGVNTPEKQVNVNLTINLITAIVSSLLLVFLNGYFDAHFTRTHEPTPPIIYFVYLFLGLVAVWQFLSFIINLNLKSKLSGTKSGEISADLSANENAISSAEAKESLPPADIENIVPASVTENTTKILDKLPRK
jgi:hypothetical protein